MIYSTQPNQSRGCVKTGGQWWSRSWQGWKKCLSWNFGRVDPMGYENMTLAKLNGWDLRGQYGEEWPYPDLTQPEDFVRQSHLKAFVLAKEIELHHQRVRPDRDFKRCVRFKFKPPAERLRPAFKSWLDHTAGNN